jgi:polysaccharide export outer membrane protein
MKLSPIKRLYCFVILAVTLFLSSCIHTKNLVYFQSDSNSKSSDSIPVYIPIYCVNDLLTITVSGADELAVQPFNKMSGSSALPKEDKGIESTTSGGEYLIDEIGMIDFPVLGRLKIAGLDRTEAKKLLIEKLKEYVADPIVDIRIKNFKITLLGQVQQAGTYPVSDERITLLQAISLASDLTMLGLRENVLVVREKDGKRIEYRVNLNSKEIFNSPVYYLHQNDIIYVEPHKNTAMTANNTSMSFIRSNIGIVTSILSVVLTFLVLLNLKK